MDKEEIYDILDQMRATIPEEIKQARWIVKERQEMLAEAKREAERIVKEARERQEQLVSEEEVTKQAERAAEDIIEDARAREREIRLGAEDYADEILNTLEVNLSKFIAAVQRGRERLQGKDEPAEVASPPSMARRGPRNGHHEARSRRDRQRRVVERSEWFSSTCSMPPESPIGTGASSRPCLIRNSSSTRKVCRANQPSSGWWRFASNSLITTSGRTTSCSANRPNAPGSDSRTEVRRTKVRSEGVGGPAAVTLWTLRAGGRAIRKARGSATP